MTEKLTQARVDRLMMDHPPGTQVYDAQCAGLRVVIGKRSCSYKLVTSLGDGRGTPVSLMLGRTTEVSLKSARQAATEARVSARRGIDPRRKKSEAPTVEEALDRYLKTHELRPRTVEFYRGMVNGPLSTLRRRPTDSITRDEVRSLHEKITRQRGARSANGSMRVLKLLLNDTLRTIDLPGGNVVTRAVRMNKETPRDWAVPPERMPDVWRVVDQMEDQVRRTAWVTLILTGLRNGDVSRLRWDDIGEDGVATIREPKGGPDRSFRLPLAEPLLAELDSLGRRSEFVFPARTSTGHIGQLRRNPDMDLSPHGARHTYRTFMVLADVPTEVCMACLNHSFGGNVSFGYVSKGVLQQKMAEAIERTASLILSYRSH